MFKPVLKMAVATSICFGVAAIANADVGTMTAKDAHIMVQRGELVLLDVRNPSEWVMTGVPRDSRTANSSAPDFLAQARGAVYGDLEHPVAVICRTGDRSAEAAKKLEAEGFAVVYNIPEGMSRDRDAGEGWLVRGLPTDPFIPRSH